MKHILLVADKSFYHAEDSVITLPVLLFVFAIAYLGYKWLNSTKAE